MRIEIIERNYKSTEKLNDVIIRKVSKLEKYFDDSAVVKVYLKKESRFSKTEITIDYKGNFIRADYNGDNFYDNIDIVLPKIEKQVYKYRTKLEKKLKESAFKDNAIYAFDQIDLQPAKLVKTKYFNLPPMSLEDAISELELIGHNFYVYLDKAANDVRVIYKRDDGNIGQIVPQV